MESTQLVYLEHNNQLTLSSRVQEISNEHDQTYLILDATIFYPQGGGQPWDQGYIENKNGKFIVTSVRFIDGIVKHFGTFEHGYFGIGDQVTSFVEPTRRALHSRIHSAGHLIDIVVARLNYTWIPGKGFHFPEGPYIEYQADVSNLDIEQIQHALEVEIKKLMAEEHAVSFRFMSKDQLANVCKNVPDYLPAGKPTRVVLFGTFGIPCGGTHVEHLSDINHVKIRKIKTDAKKNIVKISYECV